MIRELKTLIAVTREGTFAAAGQKVGLTQAAVSAQMKRLEEELGFLLFDRTGRSARLNRMGRQTVERAQELVRLYGALGARTSESEAPYRSHSAPSPRRSKACCRAHWPASTGCSREAGRGSSLASRSNSWISSTPASSIWR